MNQLKELFAKWSKDGIAFPHAYDAADSKQSFRLLTAYISFLLACISLVLLHIWPVLLVPSCVTIGFFGLNMTFYMLKKLTSAKFDLNDQEISLNSDDKAE